MKEWKRNINISEISLSGITSCKFKNLAKSGDKKRKRLKSRVTKGWSMGINLQNSRPQSLPGGGRGVQTPSKEGFPVQNITVSLKMFSRSSSSLS